uniref:Interleukin-18 n=1 Tax=Xenopus tropicalis TaxID=8364 RepID=A0A803JWR2_XENTR
MATDRGGENIDICNEEDGVLLFTVNEVQEDAWRESRSMKAVIVNTFQEFLAAFPENDLAEFINEYDPERICFNMKIYRSTSYYDGISVAFTIKVNGGMYSMCCTDQMQICFKSGDSPARIDGNTSNMIFYQKIFCQGDPDVFSFESSLKKGYYLALIQENGRHKLGLKQSQDDVDTSRAFDIHMKNGS